MGNGSARCQGLVAQITERWNPEEYVVQVDALKRCGVRTSRKLPFDASFISHAITNTRGLVAVKSADGVKWAHVHTNPAAAAQTPQADFKCVKILQSPGVKTLRQSSSELKCWTKNQPAMQGTTVSKSVSAEDLRDPRRGKGTRRCRGGGEYVASRGKARVCLSDGQEPRGTVQGYVFSEYAQL